MADFIEIQVEKSEKCIDVILDNLKNLSEQSKNLEKFMNDLDDKNKSILQDIKNNIDKNIAEILFELNDLYKSFKDILNYVCI